MQLPPRGFPQRLVVDRGVGQCQHLRGRDVATMAELGECAFERGRVAGGEQALSLGAIGGDQLVDEVSRRHVRRSVHEID